MRLLVLGFIIVLVSITATQSVPISEEKATEKSKDADKKDEETKVVVERLMPLLGRAKPDDEESTTTKMPTTTQQSNRATRSTRSRVRQTRTRSKPQRSRPTLAQFSFPTQTWTTFKPGPAAEGFNNFLTNLGITRTTTTTTPAPEKVKPSEKSQNPEVTESKETANHETENQDTSNFIDFSTYLVDSVDGEMSATKFTHMEPDKTIEPGLRGSYSMISFLIPHDTDKEKQKEDFMFLSSLRFPWNTEHNTGNLKFPSSIKYAPKEPENNDAVDMEDEEVPTAIKKSPDNLDVVVKVDEPDTVTDSFKFKTEDSEKTSNLHEKSTTEEAQLEMSITPSIHKPTTTTPKGLEAKKDLKLHLHKNNERY